MVRTSPTAAVPRSPRYEERRAGTFVNNNTLNFTLRTFYPWTRAGTGAMVFDMPTYISRVRITGTYGGLLRKNYDGTHLMSGGVVEVKNDEEAHRC